MMWLISCKFQVVWVHTAGNVCDRPSLNWISVNLSFFQPDGIDRRISRGKKGFRRIFHIFLLLLPHTSLYM
jgi:hypothetical protein